MEEYSNEARREVFALQTESEKGMQSRYFTLFDDSDISQFDVYLVGPYVGVYRFKLVKLHVSVSPLFPEVPPEVRFIHHTRHQIHPNFYVSGNTCLGLFKDATHRDIDGEVDGGMWYRMLEIWRPRMICHNMLLYIRTLLDDNPFKHEPWGRDEPELSHFVQYVTWDALLFRYLANETNSNALIWLKRYVLERGLEMLQELSGQQAANRDREYFVGPHHEEVPIDYPALIRRLGAVVVGARTSQLLSLTAGNSRQPMEEAAWTWAGRVVLKWSDLFSGHPHRDFWGQQYQDDGGLNPGVIRHQQGRQHRDGS